jgi:hypothetical protein
VGFVVLRYFTLTAPTTGSHAEQNTAITAYVRCTTSGPIQGRLRHRLTHPEMD